MKSQMQLPNKVKHIYQLLGDGLDFKAEIDEPTYVVDMDKLFAEFAKRCWIKNIPEIDLDVNRINDTRYFVDKAYRVLIRKDHPTDSNTTQWRILLVRCLENLMRTQFRNTRDFKQKVKDYLRDYKTKKKPVNERLKKARNKKKLTQKELAEILGYKSHVPIAYFESGERYPSKKVFQWLEQAGM